MSDLVKGLRERSEWCSAEDLGQLAFEFRLAARRIEHLEADLAELRERWRSCVDTIDAIRSTLANDDTREYVAWRFHNHYEELAPEFGYVTREPSAVPWARVPEQNRRLMIATSGHVLRDLLDRLDLGGNPWPT